MFLRMGDIIIRISRLRLISYEQYIGYSRTEPSEAFIEVLQTNSIEKPLDINRDGDRFIGFGGSNGIDGTNGTSGIEGKATKPKCSTRKYQCPCCKKAVSFSF